MKIEPRTLKGFRDFLPEQQIARQKMIDTIRASYEKFGFEPLETPVLEYAEILTGKYGDEGDKLMYRFRDNGDRDVAMRYDLTIPLARVIAQYGEGGPDSGANGGIKKPFKRYQVSPVWRADNTQKGRFREFYQCDADIVGSNSPLADAEILSVASTTLKALGVTDFIIRVNSREIISVFYDSLGFTDEQKVAAIRAVDKIAKIGVAGVEEELTKFGASAAGAKFSPTVIKSVLAFADTSLDAVSGTEDIAKIAAEFPSIKAPLAKLMSIIESAALLAPDTRFVLDLSISRGLDYYTGMIFETTLPSAPAYGSVLSGGRYDNLIGTFAAKTVPAVGASIGLDRLIAALEELKLIGTERTTAQAMIVNFDDALQGEYLKMASQLRSAGINTILYLDQSDSKKTDMKKQLAYASDKGIRYAIIYGVNEAKTGLAIVKDMQKGTQESVKVGEVGKYLI